MQNYAKFFAGGVEPKPLGCNGLGQPCQACCKISQKSAQPNCYIRTLYALDLLPVPLGADGRPLERWEGACHEELLRIEHAFEQPEVVGIGVQLWRRRLAVVIRDLEGFLRWQRSEAVGLPISTTIAHRKGWTLLYQLDVELLRGVRRFRWGLMLGQGAVVAVPDTRGYRYLVGLERLSRAPLMSLSRVLSRRRDE